MKYFVLVLVALFQWSCATQNTSTVEETHSIEQLIKNERPVFIENQTIDKEIDFTTFLQKHPISEGIYEVKITSGITFRKCVFNKPVTAYRKTEDGSSVLTTFQGNVTFIDCIFKEAVNFKGASIYGRTDFTGTTFHKIANFEELNGHQNLFFNKTVFEGPLRFQNAFFSQKANFMSVTCYDIASFQNSVFQAELQFSAGHFYKYADFTLIDCRGKVLYNYTEFMDKAEFGHSNFFQDFSFVNTKNNTTNFNNCRFLGLAHFNNAEVITSLSFKNSHFQLENPDIDIPSQKLIYAK